MNNFIHATGDKQAIPHQHQDRRFQVVSKGRALDLPQICDICQRRRNQGNHDRCSKQRQALNGSKG